MFLAFLGASVNAYGQELALELVVDGLARPVVVTSPPGDARQFIAEQHTGQIRILADGVLLPEPFLDLGGQVTTTAEEGLLGLVFHPGYATNGWFFVNTTDLSGTTRVQRYSVSADPNVADPASAELLLSQAQPFVNHNAGDLHFGPLDGYLYVGFGDGGGARDPSCTAQNPATWLGKMLRLDVDQGLPYAIPADNPFVGDPAYRPEIWSLGWRNPWRFAFDRATGEMYVGDVGQGTREEVSWEPALTGGRNYGWKIREGFVCFGGEGCPSVPAPCQSPVYTNPIHEYSHVGFFGPCAIIGGFVYRGCALPELSGTYFLADHCSGSVWSFRYDGTSVTDYANRTQELQPSGGSLGSISSFGEDARGELYITTIAGELFRVVAGPGTAPIADCDGDGLDDDCQIALDVAADLDGNGELDRCQELSTSVASLSVAAGGTQPFDLHAGPAFAGATYLVIGSLSGTSPGFVYDGLLVPLNPDTYTLLSTGSPNLAPLVNTFANLDASGAASAAFSTPAGALPSALVGISVAHVYGVLDAALALQLVSNYVTLAIEP